MVLLTWVSAHDLVWRYAYEKQSDEALWDHDMSGIQMYFKAGWGILYSQVESHEEGVMQPAGKGGSWC